MTQEEIAFFIDRAQNDLLSFCIMMFPYYEVNWHHDVIAKALHEIEEGKCKRLIIEMPPRHGKSELASIAFPSWYIGKHPDKEIITASYSGELAQDFGSRARDVVRDPQYNSIFGVSLKEDTQAKGRWKTNKDGAYTSVGVGGTLTGRGADLLIIDDPVKNREEAESKTYREKIWNWYTSTARTRLEQDASIIVIMTRWHKDDLVGRLLHEAEEGGEQWQILRLPAIAESIEPHRLAGEALWPQKYDLTALDNLKRSLGVYDWAALYQQNPVSIATQEFKDAMFSSARELPKTLNITIVLDPASSEKEKSDENAITARGVSPDNRKYVLEDWGDFGDINRRANPKEVIDKLFEFYEKWNISDGIRTWKVLKVGIETVAYQSTLKFWIQEEMRRRGVFFSIFEFSARVAKEIRIRSLIPEFEARNFSFYHPCRKLKDQLLEFPSGAHDDRIDSLAMHNFMEVRAKVRDVRRPNIKTQVNYLTGEPYARTHTLSR